MRTICARELRQFFSSLTGFIAIFLFLLITGLYLFVFPETNVFDQGYATMDQFFDLAPWVLIFLIPAITMRSFADEFRSGTWEILQTKPLSRLEIIGGKYLASIGIVLIAILPTILYVLTIRNLSSGGIDGGGIAGAYIGLFLLAAVFTAIGLFSSSLTSNAVVAFLLGAFLCFLFYIAFSALSALPFFSGGADYYIDSFGVDAHYRSISRGVIDSRDILYFLSVIFLFGFLTARNLVKR